MIDFRRLERTCNMPTENFRGMGRYSKEGNYVFIERPGATMLAVGHLDSVQSGTTFRWNKKNVYSPRLDNRLGVYTILYQLPGVLSALGYDDVIYDVLLTDDEEMGASTAQNFTTDKSYNFMFSFDRTGDDVVMYQYDNERERARLVEAGFKPGNGSYSDIAELSHLGVAGFNIGCGMYNYHSKDAYANIKMYLQNVTKWAEFLKVHHNTRFDVQAPKRRSWSSYYSGKYDWDSDYEYKGYGSLAKVVMASYVTRYTFEGLIDNPTYSTDSDLTCPDCGEQWWDDDNIHPTDPSYRWYRCGNYKGDGSDGDLGDVTEFPHNTHDGNDCAECGRNILNTPGHYFNTLMTRYRCAVNEPKTKNNLVVVHRGADSGKRGQHCSYCGSHTDRDVDKVTIESHDMCLNCWNYLTRLKDYKERDGWKNRKK